MVYFEVNDAEEIDVGRREMILVTHHGPGGDWPRLKFSVRPWYTDRDGELKPGRGITISSEYVWKFIYGLVGAAIRAGIEPVFEVQHIIDQLEDYVQGEE